MTLEERRARRKYLLSDPFYRALNNKRAAKWREKNRERINARRREKYAERAEAERARMKARREACTELQKAAWKRWANKPANRAYLRARDRSRAADPVFAAKKAAQRKLKRATDPEFRERERAGRRRRYHVNKCRPVGYRWRFLQFWSKRWPVVVSGGPDAVEKYLRRCTPKTRSFFHHWRRGGAAALASLWGIEI